MVVKTLKEMLALQDYLIDKTLVAYDTETTGVDKDSQIIGFSVCADVEVGYYVILSYWDPEKRKLLDLETKQGAKALIQSLVHMNLIMHNAPFDCARTFENFGVELMPSVHTDTLMLGHLLNENRSNGLKERGVELYGADARAEQAAMKASVLKNGGQLTKDCYELYKADSELLAMYGAKDAILTLKLFYNDVPLLYEQRLDTFFYDEETMPLLRGPTYQMNTTGLRIDPDKIQLLKQQLQADCLEAKGFIDKEVAPHVAETYPGTSKVKTFNIGASQQRAWLLFWKLDNEFKTLTDEGGEVCKFLNLNRPYSKGEKTQFLRMCLDSKGAVYCESKFNHKTKKMSRSKKIGDPWKYVACGKDTMGLYADKYKWVARFMEYTKNLKLLNTYVEPIQEKAKYNIIRPSFLQHGTTSGRYSSKQPNFTNLPRDDKRVKACIVSRPSKVFVGADFSQLEPRVFASVSQDERLLKCFADGDDFYSVIGAGVFNKTDCTLIKDDSPDSFPVKYKKLRDVAKVIALATPYGATPNQIASKIGKSKDESAEIIRDYFDNYPGVEKMMLDSHEQAKSKGVVYSLYGRPRRMPKALEINEMYGNMTTSQLPYEIRNLLNLAMNHRVQSTAASITNRAMVRFYENCAAAKIDCRIVIMVHDEIIVECADEDAQDVSLLLKDAMENACHLPGVALVAEPKIANNLADLK